MPLNDFHLLFALCGLSLLASCKTLPEIPITTPKPIEVNLNMRLDVYQYRGDEPVDKEAAKTISEATERMRNRMAEIQTIKSNRFVGEDHRGLLQLREVPAGTWGDYVKETVKAENDDRTLLMRNQAKEAIELCMKSKQSSGDCAPKNPSRASTLKFQGMPPARLSGCRREVVISAKC